MVSAKISELNDSMTKINNLLSKAEKIEDESAKAKFIADNLVDQLVKARVPADELETIIPDELWPMPKYSEMLFIM